MGLLQARGTVSAGGIKEGAFVRGVSVNFRDNNCRGFNIFELITVMGLIAVIMGIVAYNLRELDNPLENGANQMRGFFKQVRAEAIASTSSYIVRPATGTEIETLRGTSCTDSAPVLDNRVSLELPTGATLSDTTWTFCYDSRGFPDGNIEIDLQDNVGQNKTVEVLHGGAVRIL